MKAFLYAFNALAPILFLCFLGYYLKIKGIFSEDFFKQINRFAFRYCFPAMMFVNLYSLEGLSKINYRLGGYLLCSLILMTAMGWIASCVLTNQRNRIPVLIQASVRSNFAIIGLALVEGLIGDSGLGTAASMQAPVVMYFNFLSVFVLTLYEGDSKFSFKRVGKSLVTNPLLQGLSLGLLALIIREFVPLNGDGNLVFSLSGSVPWLYTMITYLSRLATPIALIAIGGQFSFSSVAGLRKEVIGGTLMRLIVAPVVGFSMAILAAKAGLIEITPVVTAVLIAAYGSPQAVSSVPMCVEMHADGTLAGQLVVWTSFFSMFTIFGMVLLFRSIGML